MKATYYKNLQFIDLPELTNNLIIDRSNITNEYLTKLQLQSESKLAIAGNMIIIPMSIVASVLVFLYSHSEINKAYFNEDNNIIYVYNNVIYEFINEQLSSDNDTLFLPKLVEGV